MRLFVAVSFSPAVCAALLEAIGDLRQQGTANFTRPENLHLTLAFIGESERTAPAQAALKAACTGGAFSMTIGGLGHFGDLWWTGVRENPRLEALAARVQQALREEGYDIERRPWRPHVTLARRWRGPRPQVTVRETSMQVERVSLMKSERVDGKMVYTELFSVRL